MKKSITGKRCAPNKQVIVNCCYLVPDSEPKTDALMSWMKDKLAQVRNASGEIYADLKVIFNVTEQLQGKSFAI